MTKIRCKMFACTKNHLILPKVNKIQQQQQQNLSIANNNNDQKQKQISHNSLMIKISSRNSFRKKGLLHLVDIEIYYNNKIY